MNLNYEDGIIKDSSNNRPKDDLVDVNIGRANDFWGRSPVEEQPVAGLEGVEMVLYIISNSKPNKVNISIKDFMAYFKKISSYLEENCKNDRISVF